MPRMAAGVLLGTFTGDALGARWEGAPAVAVAKARERLAQSLSADVLTYTDDTQLTLALAEHLCDHPRVDVSALALTFLNHFEGHRGYARGMFGIVDAWEHGAGATEAATAVFPDGSFGNGAAMRAAPVGVVWRDDADVTIAAARAQAALTHAHPIGGDAAAAQARAVAIAISTGGFLPADITSLAEEAATDELRRTLSVAAEAAARAVSGAPYDLPEVAEELGTGVLADQSVPAALWIASVAETFPEAVVLSLGLGGDVDTIAAMACAVLGGALTEAAIPAEWVDRLEDGVRGRSYAVALSYRLADVATRR